MTYKTTMRRGDDEEACSTDWEEVEFVLTQVGLYPVDELPEFTKDGMMSTSRPPEPWTILFWALRLDGLPIRKVSFSPGEAMAGVYAKLVVANNWKGEATIEALWDPKECSVTAVAPPWFWERHDKMSSPLPAEYVPRYR